MNLRYIENKLDGNTSMSVYSKFTFLIRYFLEEKLIDISYSLIEHRARQRAGPGRAGLSPWRAGPGRALIK